MDYKIIYEAQSSYGGISPVMIIPIFIAVVVGIGTIKAWKSDKRSLKIMFAFLSAVIFLIFFSLLFNEFRSKNEVYKPYVNGKSSIIEGTIEKYVPNTDGSQLPDRFEVGSTDFAIPGFTSKWGYPLRQIDGGILKDGLKVRIHYIHYKFENVIMKLELLEGQ